jgi:hypothetical protein
MGLSPGTIQASDLTETAAVCGAGVCSVSFKGVASPLTSMVKWTMCGLGIGGGNLPSTAMVAPNTSDTYPYRFLTALWRSDNLLVLIAHGNQDPTA